MKHEGFPCDRCGGWVDGMSITEMDDPIADGDYVSFYRSNLPPTMGFTAGYYAVDLGHAWYEYRMSPDEERVCDECIHAMPLYQRNYPETTSRNR